jgi:predicted nucleotidyltransferase
LINGEIILIIIGTGDPTLHMPIPLSPSQKGQLKLRTEKIRILAKKEMIGTDKISEIVNKIASGYNPEKIILFGSYATGNPNEDSDLDLFVIKDTDLPRPQRTVQVRKMIYGSMIPIDLIVYTPKEIDESKENRFSFVYEVLNTGKTLYERAS